MEHPPSNNVNSAFLWITSQILYIFSFATDFELIFKALSIISVGMVIVINSKNFIKAVKGWWK